MKEFLKQMSQKGVLVDILSLIGNPAPEPNVLNWKESDCQTSTPWVPPIPCTKYSKKNDSPFSRIVPLLLSDDVICLQLLKPES